jgi:adhesin transport system outer membrane protein
MRLYGAMRFSSVLRWVLPAAVVLCAGGEGVIAGSPFTIFDAINEAVHSNPAVGEASANRRATETNLRQSQATLLPQVHIDASTGPERFNEQDVTPPPQGNNAWLQGSTASVVVRQKLFDGLSSINDIWRQAARVDASAYRVHERTELTALDAAEAYIDVVRFTRLISIASDNLAAHQKLLANVEARFKGGRAGEGDLDQARERVAAAQAQLVDFQQSLDSARATYRRVVGQEPFNLRPPGRLNGLPNSKDDALAVALKFNPTIRAAQSDVDAAKYAFHGTAGNFLPQVSLEAKASRGQNVDEVFGRQSDESAKVVLSWDIFTSGLNSWKRAEASERYTEATMAHARLQRGALESLDKAWGARTITSGRVAALLRQVDYDRKAISAYTKEYELGQRSLIDLLNSENQLYVALVSLESSRSVAVFADYQLLAAMGQLLSYVKSPVPAEAAPLDTIPLGIFPTKLPPILIRLPRSGPEPLNPALVPPGPAPYVPGPMKYAGESPGAEVGRRWPSVALMVPHLPGEPQAPPTAPSIDADWASGMLTAPLTMGAAR